MFSELRQQIYACFPQKPAVDYALSDALIADAYGDQRYAIEEQWETWEQITDWQVARCDVLFAFAPAKASAYFIPRYMLFSLDQIEDKIPEETYRDASDVSGDNAEFYLTNLKKTHYKDSLFTQPQIDVIELFLATVSEHE